MYAGEVNCADLKNSLRAVEMQRQEARMAHIQSQTLAYDCQKVYRLILRFDIGVHEDGDGGMAENLLDMHCVRKQQATFKTPPSRPSPTSLMLSSI